MSNKGEWNSDNDPHKGDASAPWGAGEQGSKPTDKASATSKAVLVDRLLLDAVVTALADIMGDMEDVLQAN